MPLYYNTAPPTQGSKNSITKTAKDYGIRDFLLHKNIQNPIKYPFLSTSVNGSPKGGEPFLDTMVGGGVIIQHVPLEVDGIFRYHNAILMNQYKDTDSAAPIFLDIENIPQVSIFPNSTPPSGIYNYKEEDITLYGILAKSNEKDYRKVSTLRNQYVDATKQIDMADFVSLQPVQIAQQVGSYTDEYGSLNLGDGAGVRAGDILGSILNGQGLGLAKGGVVNNFDIRASLAGRVLTATGLLNDTKLGIIGGQQLALSLANNAAFNAEQLLLGKLNIEDNILSLVKNGTFAGLRGDFKITTPTSDILDYSERILGFTVPRSFLSDAGSIFLSENGGVGNIERANAMLLNTGRGQITALLSNINANLIGTSPNQYDSPDGPLSIFRSGYAAGYTDDKGKKAINPKGYAFMDKDGLIYNFFKTNNKQCIPEISWNRDRLVTDAGFTSFEDNTYTVNDGRPFATKFAWTSDQGDAINSTATIDTFTPNSLFDLYVGDKKTLLSKTQKLFNSVGMKNIIAVKGDRKVTTKTQIQSAVSPNGFISRGSGILSGSKFNGDGTFNLSSGDTPDNTFCRSWTPFNRYDNVSRLIRNRGLNQTESGGHIIPEGGQVKGGWRQNTHGSVLDNNGFTKIAPYKTDNLSRQSSAPKKYMFSIENLAWVGTPAVNLLPSEQGSGDLLTGKFGRIMWFPPYDITFNETSSVSLESTNFIGRGEPVYTYNNTERTGTLNFKIIVDHPSIMNSFAGDNKVTDEYIDSFFAGCVDLDEKWAKKLTGLEINEIEQTIKKDVPKVTTQSVKLPSNFKIYFENDVTQIVDTYEITNNINSGVGTYVGEPQKCNGVTQVGRTFVDNQSFGLNVKPVSIPEGVINGTWAGWVDKDYQAALVSFMTVTCPTCKIKITGSASAQKLCNEANVLLAKNRAKNTYDWFLANIVNNDKTKITIDSTNTKPVASSPKYNNTTSSASQSVKEDRFVSIQFYDVPEQTPTPKDIEATNTNNKSANRTLTTDIKRRFYTEADFFEKLTDADSFVFDKIREKIKFFHPAFHSTTPEGLNSRLTFLLQCTRQGPTINGTEARNLAFGPPPVCILRVGDFYNTKIMMDNVSFDFEPLVWDLNPEGVGVQPMIANVTISFKFIGGSSLYGPINKLQNALSFNYFANTQVYDPRADYISAVKDIEGSKLSSDRKTFGDKSKKSQLESNYALVRGLDSTNTPMSEISSSAINTTDDKVEPSNPTKDSKGTQIGGSKADNTQTTKQTTTSDFDKIKIGSTYETMETTNDGVVAFTIVRKSNSDTSQLTKAYKLKVTITNINKSTETYQQILSTELNQTELTQAFTVSFNETTPVCSGFELNNKYSLSVELIGTGKSMKINLN